MGGTGVHDGKHEKSVTSFKKTMSSPHSPYLDRTQNTVSTA